MAKTIKIDPVTRIEGHLAVRVEVEDHKVARAYCSGEMFRGFEVILAGRHPMDAQQITQRICGVCPISHGIASAMAQEAAYGMAPPANGRTLRNLTLAANFLMSHITHFYHLSVLDFIDIAAIGEYRGRDPQLRDLRDWVKTQLASKRLYPAAPFLPRYEGSYLSDAEGNFTAIRHYLHALEIRADCHKMAALFAGKMPHAPAIVPGGMTGRVAVDKILSYRSLLKKVSKFIEHEYLPDLMAISRAFPAYFTIGRGCGNFLAYGGFAESELVASALLPPGVLVGGDLQPFEDQAITEDVGYSLFSSPSNLPPAEGRTVPAPDKSNAYSWLKAPRYRRQVMEVGPLARLLVADRQNHPVVKGLLKKMVEELGRRPRDLDSTMGRHLARGLECKILADRCFEWLETLQPGAPASEEFTIPAAGRGAGFIEAPRGALGHWLSIAEGRIENYQCVVPTTWNCSPRDDRNQPGAVEQALVATPVADSDNPLEAARVVRAFDPCLACAVH